MERRAFLAIVGAAPLFGIGGPTAPQFRGKTLDGEKFSNDSLKGHVVLLQFWTTWCHVCRADQEIVDALATEYAGQGLVVIAVSVAESRRTVEKYLDKSPRVAKIVVNQDTNLPAVFEARAFPKYVIIDANGRLIGEIPGGDGGRGALRRMLVKAGLSSKD